MRRKTIEYLRFVFAACIAFALIAVSAFAQGANAGRSLPKAELLGPENLSKEITVTLWLKQHNQAAFDELVRQMYDKNSPNFHHFLTMTQYQARFAPTAKEAAMVRDFLAGRNLRVTSIDKSNHYVIARGRIADMQTAFNTQINRVMLNGAVHRMNASEAAVVGPAAPLVAAVQGLSDLGYRSDAAPAFDPETRTPYAGVRPSAIGSDGLFFSADCLRPPQTITFTTGGGFPTATYTGNRYGADITSGIPNLPPCGYDAAEMQTAYRLNPLYQSGLNGKGQTIVIVDAFGSNTIRSDANLFSSLNGLPALTSSNFHIFKPNGVATCTRTNGCIAGNWQFETTLDVEWAHAIAPGANIALVLGADNSFTNLDIANLFAIENGLGNVISNSFGIPEIALVVFLPSELVVENGISQIAAALGISLNVSSGDSGDNLALDRAAFGIDSVSTPANDSPFTTVIGGTSTFLNAHHFIKLQTGWGLNFVRIAEPTPNPPTIPPLFFGFQFGSGGGTSVVFAKPAYQSGLSGDFRQVPDISMNADPETGNEIIVTPDSIPGHQKFVEVFGGTSLSCPMFSALWAIANQAAGGGPVGEAAPILYQLPLGAIIDVKAVSSGFNVTGVINNPPNPPQKLSPAFLAQPLENTTRFVSALFQSPASTRWDVFTFGTDSSLTTGTGWDNVTGLGTPNGSQFIQGVVAAVQ
ncbi:MAG TPA: S53 family peptidase [Terriglobales bacterium]|nr:S53 family peptidase [Terriglobales bacterium]